MMPTKTQEQGIRLPTPEQTLLLRACLLSAAAARAAWAEWLEETADPIDSIRRDSDGLRRLLPLLLVAAKRNRFAIDGLLRTTLRTAYVCEQWRMSTYRQVLARAMGAFSAAGIDVVILNGAALANFVYDDPGIRHCHDIDVLTTDEGMDFAGRVLRRFDFRPVIQHSQHASFEHSSNLPLELYTRLRYQQKSTSPFSTICAETNEHVIDNYTVHTLRPVDSLLQICSHPATQEQRLPLGVFCDAWFFIQRHSGLSWSDLVDSANRFGIEPQCRVVLAYLREMLGAAVPKWSGADSADTEDSESMPRRVPFFGA